MFFRNDIESHLERILLSVQKPGRYVGGEYNTTIKDWDSVQTKVALVFPDIYEIGVSNLGVQILYDTLNQRSDTLAERAYAPWVDMEEKMRTNGIPLYSLETKHPLIEFDMLGFSLPYETLYTNTLNLLDLARIPIRAMERDDSHPLIIAGGHACFNPEPMSPFMDAFVIGEGEQVIHEIIDVVHAIKKSNNPSHQRENLLHELVKMPGVYVPKFYNVRYSRDDTIDSVTPTIPAAPKTVLKRIVEKLPPPPVKVIVPNIDIVHNHVSIEIMRGCTRGCRFCQAGMITRPVRERSVDEIVQAAEEAIAATGYEELALLSLSTSDYSHILKLVATLSQRFGEQHLTVSLPSLRIETVSVELMESIKIRRSGGFTLAPEAATERIRHIINKPINDEEILATVREIYSRGWASIKLYFMIGLPSETLDDVQAIADLCKRVLSEGRRVLGGKAKVHAGVSTFIPKAHTPFQWTACDTVEQIQAKQQLLMQELRGRAFKLSWTPPEDTLLEAWLSRGDRRLAEVIYTAWKNGAKFDAWGDQRHFEAWTSAFASHGIDPTFYTYRIRRDDEIFPWEHISNGVHKKYLFADYLRSMEGKIRQDCRERCDACGVLSVFVAKSQEDSSAYWKCPEAKKQAIRDEKPVSASIIND